MDIQEYISSGILELYVCGALTEEQSREVSSTLKKHESIRSEVEEIEDALQQLATATAPYDPQSLLDRIKQKINNAPNTENAEVVSLKSARRQRTLLYLSAAASFLFLIGIFTLLYQNNNLRRKLTQQQIVSTELDATENQLLETQKNLNETENLLNVFRDRNVLKIPLAGQDVAPDAYVNVFWDQQQNKTYIDAQGLPEPPEGKVYQVWSLKLTPLTPTSIGLLSDFEEDENKIFELNNPNDSEAFGITLEPAGGSESPTMEQLYTLGAISS